MGNTTNMRKHNSMIDTHWHLIGSTGLIANLAKFCHTQKAHKAVALLCDVVNTYSY